MPEPLNTVLIVLVVGLAFAMFATLGFLGYLVWRDTKRGHGKWGVNKDPIFCPRCGEPAPVVRIPKNFRQMLWGGATCSNCACEYDKWGKPLELPGGGDLARYQPPPEVKPVGDDDAIRKRNDDLQRGTP
jgi:hypothetical protein